MEKLTSELESKELDYLMQCQHLQEKVNQKGTKPDLKKQFQTDV